MMISGTPYDTATKDELRELLRDVCYERDTQLIQTDTKQYVGQYYALATDFRKLNRAQKERVLDALKDLLKDMYYDPESWYVKTNWPQSEQGQPAHDLLLLTMWIGRERHFKMVEEMIQFGTYDKDDRLKSRLLQVREWMEATINQQ